MICNVALHSRFRTAVCFCTAGFQVYIFYMHRWFSCAHSLHALLRSRCIYFTCTAGKFSSLYLIGNLISIAWAYVRRHCTITTYPAQSLFNPLTAPARKLSGLKSAQKHACKQHIWWTCNNSTPNAVPFGRRTFGRRPFGRRPFGRRPFGRRPFGRRTFGRRPFTCSGEEGKSLNVLKSGTSTGRFSSDGAACRAAVKRLMAYARDTPWSCDTAPTDASLEMEHNHAV